MVAQETKEQQVELDQQVLQVLQAQEVLPVLKAKKVK